MKKEKYIRLTPAIYEKYWAYIPDGDIIDGSDGESYVYESAFIYYVKVKNELDYHITEIEKGKYPKV